jgi:thymidylate kinase
MKIDPIYVWNSLPSADNRDGMVVRSKNPVLAKVMEERRNQLRRPQDQESHLLDRIAFESRVIVIEGISGAGKDTLQAYLKKLLENRDVHDYSEGEVLHSWKQMLIEGIFELRIKFMKLFVNYIRDTVSRDEKAVFLLNRFHLSTYVFTIIQQPELEREYDEIINVLRTLPIHVFILQLDEKEIEQRSLHPERTGAWRQFQQKIAKEDGFRDKLERYICQQRIMLESARKQQIPYSVLKLPPSSEVEDTQARVSKTRSVIRRGVRIKAVDAKPS